MDLLELGTAVRTRRKALRLTLPALAAKSGVSRSRIADLERGRLPDIGFKRLTRILHALNLDVRLTELNLQRPTLEDLMAEEGT